VGFFGSRNNDEDKHTVDTMHAVMGYMMISISTIIYGSSKVYWRVGTNIIVRQVKATRDLKEGVSERHDGNNEEEQSPLVLNDSNFDALVSSDSLPSLHVEEMRDPALATTIIRREILNLGKGSLQLSNRVGDEKLFEVLGVGEEVALTLLILSFTSIITLLLAPVLLTVWHYSGLETFQLPYEDKQWHLLTLLCALSLGSNVTFVIAIQFTEPLFVSLGFSFCSCFVNTSSHCFLLVHLFLFLFSSFFRSVFLSLTLCSSFVVSFLF